MSFQHIKHISIAGIAAAVPKSQKDNMELELLGSLEEREKFVSSTGIHKRYILDGAPLCTSDLCFESAQQLLQDLGWDRGDIDCLIFVTQTPDYILPATSCTLQHRLGLPQSCFALDISLGCSGWCYGLSVIGSLMQSGNFKKGLLLCGDTVSVTKSPYDKTTYPLFGDAGTATGVCFDEHSNGIFVHAGTDGGGAEAIMIKDGGFRNFFSADSLKVELKEDGVLRNNLQSYLDGTAVFIFGITKAPQSINALLSNFQIDKESVDYFILHQANNMMNEKIRKKIGVGSEKLPISLNEYGNTSSASIPLTIVTRLGDELSKGNHKLICCGFGVGLSWASVYLETRSIVISNIIYV